MSGNFPGSWFGDRNLVKAFQGALLSRWSRPLSLNMRRVVGAGEEGRSLAVPLPFLVVKPWGLRVSSGGAGSKVRGV